MTQHMPSLYLKVSPAMTEHEQALKRIYQTSFPEAERRPWEDFTFFNYDSEIKPEVPQTRPRLMAVCISEDRHTWLPIGMFSFWELGKILYIEHFAIDPDYRGRGIGDAVFQAMGVHYARERGLTTVLEVEPLDEEKPDTVRRIEFYRRHGLEVVDTDYVQPPYESGLPPVDMWLMASGTDTDTDTITRLLYTHVYHF